MTKVRLMNVLYKDMKTTTVLKILLLMAMISSGIGQGFEDQMRKEEYADTIEGNIERARKKMQQKQKYKDQNMQFRRKSQLVEGDDKEAFQLKQGLESDWSKKRRKTLSSAQRGPIQDMKTYQTRKHIQKQNEQRRRPTEAELEVERKFIGKQSLTDQESDAIDQAGSQQNKNKAALATILNAKTLFFILIILVFCTIGGLYCWTHLKTKKIRSNIKIVPSEQSQRLQEQ